MILRRKTVWVCTAPGCKNICCMVCCGKDDLRNTSKRSGPGFLCRGPKLLAAGEQCYNGVVVFHQNQDSGSLIHGGASNVARGNSIMHSFGPGRHQVYVCEMGQLFGSKKVHRQLMAADAFSPAVVDAPVFGSGAPRIFTIARMSAASQLELIISPHFIAVLSRFTTSPNDLDDGNMRVMPQSIVDYMNENDDAFLRIVEASMRYEIVRFDTKKGEFRAGRVMQEIADNSPKNLAPSWADFVVYAFQYLLAKNGAGPWPLPALSLPWCLYGFEERLVIATRSTGRAAGRSRVGGLRSSTACPLLRSSRLSKF